MEKKSKIRSYFEKSDKCGAVACYADNEIGIRKIILNKLKGYNGLSPQIINLIIGIIEFLIGKRRFGTIAEESDCIVINSTTRTFWFFTKSEDLTKISRNKISAVKVSTDKSFLIFRSTVCTIYASGVSDQVAYAVKCPYKEIKEKAENWLA